MTWYPLNKHVEIYVVDKCFMTLLLTALVSQKLLWIST